MKNIKNLAQGILFLFVIMNLSSCDTVSEKHAQLEVDEKQLNADIKLYTSVWDKIINDRQIDLINEDAFDLNVTAVATSNGDIVGLENFKKYYANYVVGFSDAEFTFIDVFGQGDKIVKHWNFKGTHDGDFLVYPLQVKK